MSSHEDVPGPIPDQAGDERAREAAAHLQRATLEFIEAARAILDIAEEAVREPGGVMTVLTETLGGLVEAVGTVAPGWVDRGRHAGRPGAGIPHPDADVDAARDGAADPTGGRAPAPKRRADRPGVEHIRIS